jgi:isoquinoline 1-oxidoreductase alpha subunit
MSQSVKINDKSYPIDVEGDMPLLWFLRDKLELTGTKFGCGMGLCGACFGCGWKNHYHYRRLI